MLIQSRDVIIQNARQFILSHISILIPHQMVFKGKAVTREHLLPFLQEAKVQSVISGIGYTIAVVLRQRCREVRSFIRFSVGAEHGSKHQGKSGLIMNLLFHRCPQQLIVGNKDNFRIQISFTQFLIQRIKHPNIQICGHIFSACFALAEIIEIVSQPDMQIVHMRILLRVGNNFPNHTVCCIDVGIAQLRIQRLTGIEFAFPIDFSQHSPLFVGDGTVLNLIPSACINSDCRTGPAMAHPMQKHTALLDLLQNALHIVSTILAGIALSI